MKCTNCGKNNASCHYKYTINGKTEEMHLCPECAREMQPEREFASRTNSMMREVWGEDSFFGRSLMDDFFGGESLMDRFFRRPMLSFGFPMFGVPLLEVGFPQGSTREKDEKPCDTPETKKTGEVDPELSKRREINALRNQMQEAVKAEEFERAAEIRDKLRELEK